QVLQEQLKTTNAVPANLTAGPAISLTPGTTLSASASSASQPVVAAANPSPVAPQGAAAANPLQFQIGSAFITPIGVMAFTGVFRNHNAGNGIGSNFAGLPYGITSAAGAVNLSNHITEARLSMQNSRIGFRVDALVKGAHVIGYMESDFLGNNASNLAV